jgi:uncharacterized protein YgbK (DUF1537 family)
MLDLGIVADDLTGAMDTGVQFSKWGLHTVVMLNGGESPSAEVVVISTDSRDETAAEAYRRAKQAAQRLSDRTLYKKIDSTLRGNIGPELDGLLDGLGLEKALVAPAFPPAGRTTVDGCHRVHGALLAESAFARDPLWPATESHLPTLLVGQTRRTVGYLPLSVVEQGEQAVIRALMAEPASIVAADAAEPRHLRTLALALAHLGQKWLPCGSAGLAEEWPLALGFERSGEVPICWSPDMRPVLIVAGSRHQSTARQLQRAVEDGSLSLVNLSVAQEDWQKAVRTDVVSLLSQGRNVALTTTFSEYREGKEAATAEMLAQATAWILAHSPVAGVIMTGGDIARAVCRALGAMALGVLGEVQAGVPAGVVVGGLHNGLRVVTKAGGFGDDLAILQSIHCIQRG